MTRGRSLHDSDAVYALITPIYLGGSDSIANLQPLCRECNSSKTDDTTNWVLHREAEGFLYEDVPEPRF